MKRVLWTSAWLLLLVVPGLAERPSLPWVRDAEATHVLVGRVKHVYEREVVIGGRGVGRIDTHYLVELEIDRVERGEGFQPKDLAYIRCWQVTKRWRPPTPGASGHGPIPQAGHHIRAWVAKGPYSPTRQEDNGLAAVYPNGIEILDAKALRSKARLPRITVAWPLWSRDRNADEPGDQSGFVVPAIPAPEPDAENDGVRKIRLRVQPGLDENGKPQIIRSLHVEIGGGWMPVITAVAIEKPWRSFRSKNGKRLAFAAPDAASTLPTEGLWITLEAPAADLQSAQWRGARWRLSTTASLDPLQWRDPAQVAEVSWGRGSDGEKPVDVRLLLPVRR